MNRSRAATGSLPLMKIVIFCHSLVSDWNHGNAHFLRGVVSELLSRGHDVAVYEPRDAWSRRNLVREQGREPLQKFERVYPGLSSRKWDFATLDLDEALDGADLVIAHEWNESELIARLGRHRRANPGYLLLFHDTHHRSATNPRQMAEYDLSNFDGALVFGEVIRRLYLKYGWAERAWTWHEAADTRVFQPCADGIRGDLVWIGNWGDDERTAELNEFLYGSARDLGLSGRVHGVRYPREGKRTIAEAGLRYCGWLPNFEAPHVFSQFRFTVHIPRRPYVRLLPGIPTIRPFEALACELPLICSPWDDAENLFTPGRDYLVARNGAEMKRNMRMLLNEPDTAAEFARHGLRTIRRRHTCRHRVDQLFEICREFGIGPAPAEAEAESETAQTGATA